MNIEQRKARQEQLAKTIAASPEYKAWAAETTALAQADGTGSQEFAFAKMHGAYNDGEPDAFRAAGDNGKRLHFGAATAKRLASGVSTKTVVPIASSGAQVVAQELRADPIALGKPAEGLLDVLPVMPHGSPEFAYLRQSTRTNNAAVVAAGAVKPTSQYAVSRIANSLSVIAHLTEAVQSYWLLDNGALQGWIQGELSYGLSRAVENKTLADINGTSGIQTQAFATSVPATIRKSMTKLEILGYVASAIVLHPSDFEGIELLLSSTNAVEHMGLPYDPATRRLYGVPIATTVSQAVGTAHVIGNGAVALDTDNLGVQLRWSDQGADSAGADMFSTNGQRARLEGRFATSVYRPAGVVVAALS